MADEFTGEVRIYWEKPLAQRYQEAMAGEFGDGPRCPVLATERLRRLRMLRPDDLDFLTELDTNERVVRYIHGGTVSAGSARQYAEAVIESAPRRADLHRWIIETAHSSQRIGWIELSKYRQESKREDLSDDVQISYQLSPDNWARGYATEAARAVRAMNPTAATEKETSDQSRCRHMGFEKARCGKPDSRSLRHGGKSTFCET